MDKQLQKIEVSDLLGKPFAWYARGPEAYDCWGLVLEVARRAGVYLPDEISIRRPQVRSRRMDQVFAGFTRIAEPEPYCLVTFVLRRRYVGHIGFVLADGKRFIHVTESQRVSITRLDDVFWRRRIDGYYRVIDLRQCI
jgi:cell wall-associated NlpC family hydrolase